MKYEWKKAEKSLYGSKGKPECLDVPSQKYILISGVGNPNEADFSERVSALYSLAYAIKMRFKSAMKTASEDVITDFAVYPLEGIWEKSATDTGFDKKELKYTIMIKQPDFVTAEMFSEAMEAVKKKKPNALYEEIHFDSLQDGKSVQILHTGSYDDEPASFAKMEAFMEEMGLARCSLTHREIYLSNPGRTAPEKLKTLLRYSVRDLH